MAEERKTLGLGGRMVIGAFGGMGAASICHPFDVVRVQLQVRSIISSNKGRDCADGTDWWLDLTLTAPLTLTRRTHHLSSDHITAGCRGREGEDVQRSCRCSKANLHPVRGSTWIVRRVVSSVSPAMDIWCRPPWYLRILAAREESNQGA